MPTTSLLMVCGVIPGKPAWSDAATEGGAANCFHGDDLQNLVDHDLSKN